MYQMLQDRKRGSRPAVMILHRRARPDRAARAGTTLVLVARTQRFFGC